MLQLPLAMMVLLLGTDLVPIGEFRLVGSEMVGCPYAHYHARVGGVVTSLDGDTITDLRPNNCGYGITGSDPAGIFSGEAILVPFEIYPVGPGLTDSDMDGLSDTTEMALGSSPTNPDSNSNGIPDGSEDFDLDGLTNNQEIYEFGTDPDDADSLETGTLDLVAVKELWQARTFTFSRTVMGALRNTGITLPDMQQTANQLNHLAYQFNTRFVPVAMALDVDGGDANQDGIYTRPELAASMTVFSGLVDSIGGRGTYIGFGQAGFLPTDFGGASAATLEGDFNYYADWDLTEALSVRAEFAANRFAHEYLHDQLGVDATQPADPRDIMNLTTAREDYVRLNGLGDTTFSDSLLCNTQLLKTFRYQGLVYDHDGFTTARWPQQGGRVTDAMGDIGGGVPGYQDIDQVQFEARDGDDRLDLSLSLSGTLSLNDRFQVRFYWDTDDDTGTGFSGPGGAAGIDKELVLTVDATLDELAPRIYSALTDNLTFQTIGGPRAFAIQAKYQFGGSMTAPIPAATMLLVRLSKAQLGLSADQVPVFVQTENFEQAFSNIDSTSLVLDLNEYMNDPTLDLSIPSGPTSAQQSAGATVGQPLPGAMLDFAVTQLTPSTAFDLYFDEAVLASDTTDAQGSFSGSFTIPGNAGGTHFLTAQDATGSFGATLLTVPEASGNALATVALAVLYLRARTRRRG